MKKSLFICLILTCNFAHSNDATLILNAKNDMLDKLKDPDSAKFYDLKVITNSKGLKSVCGRVNSKNSYGGYVGKQDFFSYEAYTNILDPNDKINFNYYQRSGCGGALLEKNIAYEDLASNGCDMNWTLLESNLIKNIPEEKSLDTTIETIKNNAIANNKKLSQLEIENLKKQYKTMLATIKSDEDFLVTMKDTRITTEQKRMDFISTCIPATISFFKSQENR